MKHWVKAALLCLLALMLAGCAEVNVLTGVDRECRAILEYNLSLSLAELPQEQQKAVQYGIKDFIDYFTTEKGFTLSEDSVLSGENIQLTLEYSEQGTDYADAFRRLEKILKDEDISLFMQLDSDYMTTKTQDLYHLNGSIDLPKVIALSNIADFSPSFIKAYEDGAAQSTGSLTIFLPASDIKACSGKTSLGAREAVMTLPLSFYTSTQATLTTKLNRVAGIAVATPSATLATLYRTALFAGLVLLAIAIAAFLFWHKHRSKNNPLPPQTPSLPPQ